MSSPMPRPLAIDANGYQFSGLEWGPAHGRPVLLLHGFPQRADAWGQIAGQLADAGLRAVAIDQRGYSSGARPTAITDYALPKLVSDAVAFIDFLGGSVDLVGHDWGGVVGWQVAARQPEKVRSWVALSTPNTLSLNEVLAVDAEQRARFSYITVFRERGEALLLADGAARLRSLYGTALSADQIDSNVAFFSQPGTLTAALNWYRAMSPHDADAMGRVSVPTTYLWGSHDRAFGHAAARRTAVYVDGPYEFVPLEGGSHWLLDEAPDAVAQAITARVLGA